MTGRTTLLSQKGTLSVDDRAEHLPAQESEQDELDDAAGHVHGVRAADAAEVDAGPYQDADDPDDSEQ